MNRYVLDTNIVLAYFQGRKGIIDQVESLFPLFTKENITAISIVSVGELLSLALQRKWGTAKTNLILELIEELVIVDINADDIINCYAEIDAFSQGKSINTPLPIGVSSRNMGKNDLWIAATVSIAKATLISTDKDFQHLDKVFLDVLYVDIAKA